VTARAAARPATQPKGSISASAFQKMRPAVPAKMMASTTATPAWAKCSVLLRVDRFEASAS
jgi:hypothetical protein